MADDEEVRRERADELHEEVEALKSGRERRRPQSPREFTDEQASEEREAQNGEDDDS